MKRALIFMIFISAMTWTNSWAADKTFNVPNGLPVITDTYQISFGPQMEAIPGDPAFLVPLRISVTQPTDIIELIFSYDPVLLTPTLLAPNMFFQSFTYDKSMPGLIRMALTTDLPPPQYIPPILGDTIFGWISFRVTTRDIGYDYLTHITYYEDPITPYPDNHIVLDNRDIIASPPLELVQGDILVWHPNYGDINLNGYPFEIGDAVLFLNYFMGLTQFSRRQYANSDCNRDGIQASISDLVFMLRRISGDTTFSAPLSSTEIAGLYKLPGTTSDQTLLPSDSHCDLTIDGDISLGGASFTIDLSGDKIKPKAVLLDSSASFMQLFCSLNDDILKVTVVNLDGRNPSFSGGKLFSIVYPGQEGSTEIINAEFSDNEGYAATPTYRLNCSQANSETRESSIKISGYPNPFNGRVSIAYYLPSDGNYAFSIYDILGRKTKTLFTGQRKAGSGNVLWDATSDDGLSVASGTYFFRLQGDTGWNTMKLFLLK
jgi:hypothetical protein